MSRDVASVKVGIVGLGNIGRKHVLDVMKMNQATLVGVCDVDEERATQIGSETGVTAYTSHTEMFAHSGVEAVIIAVPHYDHVPVALDAFQAGVHVLCEKPLAVHVHDANAIISAHEQAQRQHPGIVFAMMFNERTFPFHRKIKEVLDEGTLGTLVRATWINTKWFRTQAYYDSGSWRATWAGEGGGILTNQCPHNLDMYQWLFGLPKRIRGHAHIGKYHTIEVEDEVTAYFEHENGMIGHFIVSTAESPGTNRLEIVGEMGKLIFEDNQLILHQNDVSMIAFSRETSAAWGTIPSVRSVLTVDTEVTSGHAFVTERFIDAILHQSPLVAQGAEGIGSVTLANGIMLSSFTNQTVELPFDPDLFELELQARIQQTKERTS